MWLTLFEFQTSVTKKTLARNTCNVWKNVHKLSLFQSMFANLIVYRSGSTPHQFYEKSIELKYVFVFRMPFISLRVVIKSFGGYNKKVICALYQNQVLKRLKNTLYNWIHWKIKIFWIFIYWAVFNVHFINSREHNKIATHTCSIWQKICEWANKKRHSKTLNKNGCMKNVDVCVGDKMEK